MLLWVCRSIGDHDLKAVGVIAQPEVQHAFVGKDAQVGKCKPQPWAELPAVRMA